MEIETASERLLMGLVRCALGTQAIANVGPVGQPLAARASAAPTLGVLNHCKPRQVDGLAERRLGQQGTAIRPHGEAAWTQTVADDEVVYSRHRPKLWSVIERDRPKADPYLLERPGCEP